MVRFIVLDANAGVCGVVYIFIPQQGNRAKNDLAKAF